MWRQWDVAALADQETTEQTSSVSRVCVCGCCWPPRPGFSVLMAHATSTLSLSLCQIRCITKHPLLGERLPVHLSDTGIFCWQNNTQNSVHFLCAPHCERRRGRCLSWFRPCDVNPGNSQEAVTSVMYLCRHCFHAIACAWSLRFKQFGGKTSVEVVVFFVVFLMLFRVWVGCVAFVFSGFPVPLGNLYF